MKENVDLEEFNRQRIENAKQKGHYSEILIFFRGGRRYAFNQIKI